MAKKAAKVETKKEFGNKDTDQKYDLSKLTIPDDHYVVRHFMNITLANGQQVEDPTTTRLQVYDKETFDNLSKQKVKDGKQIGSQFENLGINVHVLHDPTV